MHAFSGSQNSRYFAYQHDGVLSLFNRNQKLLWRKDLSHLIFNILGVGNDGNIVIQSNQGLILFEASEPNPELIKTFTSKALSEQSSYIRLTFLNSKGTQICLDKVSEDKNLPSKIISVFAPSAPEKAMENHEIVFYSIINKNYTTYYRYTEPKNLGSKFIWNISRDFNFILTGEPHKTSNGIKMRFSIVNVSSYEEYFNFAFLNPVINEIMINNNGTAIVDTISNNNRDLIIVTQFGQSFTIRTSMDAKIMHLGTSFVALWMENEQKINIKTFQDGLVCIADFKVLNSLNIPYDILFNETDNIDIIYYLDDEINIQSSGIDRIHIDARRWELYAEELKSKEENEKKPKGRSYAQFDNTIPAQASESSLKNLSSANAKDKRASESGNKNELHQKIDLLREQFITGQISEEYFAKEKDKVNKLLTSLGD